jgi:hypothetical protein
VQGQGLSAPECAPSAERVSEVRQVVQAQSEPDAVPLPTVVGRREPLGAERLGEPALRLVAAWRSLHLLPPQDPQERPGDAHGGLDRDQVYSASSRAAARCSSSSPGWL